MTIAELAYYLRDFPGDTPVVIGNRNDAEVSQCEVSMYYPPHLEETFWIVLDPKKEVL